MSAPQQPWGPPPPQWGPPPGPAPSGRGSTPLLVLGLVTAVLGFIGTVLPTEDYPDGAGYYGPLVQSIGGTARFQAGGLVLLVAVVLLVVGALLQRRRVTGTGLLLVGAGVLALEGLQLLFTLLQTLLDAERSGSLAVGGVVLLLAGCTAVSTAVVGLVRLR